MTERVIIAFIACSTTVALALIVPVWVLGVPVILLSGSASIAVARDPELARLAITAVLALLGPPKT